MNESPASPSRPALDRRRRLALIAAVVVGALLVGGLISAVLLNLPRAETGDASPPPSPSASAVSSPSDTPSSPEPSPLATAEPTATPEAGGPAPIDWTAGTAPNGHVAAVAWLGDRWLAAGFSAEEGNRPRAATWTSTDGLSWEPGAEIEPDPAPGPEGQSFMIDGVLVLADEILAFGWNAIGCCDAGGAALWRSTDGVTWEYLEPPSLADGGTYHHPFDAAVAPTGELVLLSATGLGGGTSFFTSSDAATWAEHPIDGNNVMLRTLAASDETMLAVGTALAEGQDLGPLAWTSADGRSWSPLEAPDDAGPFADVTWDPNSDRFVVVGTDANGRPAVWLTEDGTSWSRTTLADGLGNVTSVSADAGLIVAAGLVGGRPDDQLIAWSSFDGVTWEIAPLDTDVGGSPVVATAGERAVVHVTATGPEPDFASTPLVWSGTLTD